MPALDYDFDYYEYRNGRRVTGTSNITRTSANRTSTTNRAAASRVAANSRSRTYQVARATTANRVNTVKRTPENKSKIVQKTKTNSTKRVVTNKKISNTSNKIKATPKRNTNIDIPLNSSKKINNKPQEMTLKKPIIEEKAKASFSVAVRKMALVSVFFFLFFLICYRYSIINEQFNGINKLKKELVKIETANEQLQADIEGKTDLTYVENYAKYQLGMQKPTTSQIQYVSVEKQDKITTPVTIDEDKELNWFEKVISEIRNYID